MTSDPVTCASCGTPVADPGLTPVDERTPCPNCGSKNVNHSRGVFDSARASESATVTRTVSHGLTATLVRLKGIPSSAAVGEVTVEVVPPVKLNEVCFETRVTFPGDMGSFTVALTVDGKLIAMSEGSEPREQMHDAIDQFFRPEDAD